MQEAPAGGGSGGVRALLRRRAARLAGKARLRAALAGHDSWPPARAGALVRFTDQPDPFSGVLAPQVGDLF
jgi:hypothetical protein